MLALLLVARGADFLSTWIATPRLVLEGNPVARKLGWKWGTFVNLAVCLLCATIPVASVVIITTSLLVAARNFQSAWLMHSMGEEDYRDWHVARLRQTPTLLFGACLAGQVVLVASVGVGLVGFSPVDSVPFAIGLGIITYALAVALYTTLAAWRIRRAHDS
jgi:hypothetical protein